MECFGNLAQVAALLGAILVCFGFVGRRLALPLGRLLVYFFLFLAGFLGGQRLVIALHQLSVRTIAQDHELVRLDFLGA